MSVDAIIAGGGPAGSVAGALLARAGWRISIVERRTPGQGKACGHCLNPRAIAALDRIGLLHDVRRIADGQTTALAVHLPGCPCRAFPLPSRSSHDRGLIVDRSRFDQMLLDAAAAAGAEVLQPAALRVLRAQPGCVRVAVTGAGRNMTLRSGLLIGADGLGSGVARAAGLAVDARIGRKYGFSFNIRTPRASIIEPGTIAMFITRCGYLGVVNQGGGRLHVGALVAGHAAADGAREPIRFVHQAAQKHAALRALGLHALLGDDMQRFAAIGPMPWRPRCVANACAALIGDAAGYVEPFTGEGMSWAIASAQTLANVLDAVQPGQWNGALARAYQRAWNHAIGRRQRACRLISFAAARPVLAARLLNLASGWPAAARLVVEQVVAA